MTFEEIIPLLFQGKRIRRKCWDLLPTSYIIIEKFNNSNEFLYYHNKSTPFACAGDFSNEDVLANDWEVID